MVRRCAWAWWWSLACAPGPTPREEAPANGVIEAAPAPGPATGGDERPATPPEVVAALPGGSLAPRWIAAGGGSLPEFNQVSLEQDLALARAVLGDGGLLLFAGGRGAHGVQVADAAAGADPLLAQLADLFAPRGGRAARYRATTLPVDAAATRANVEAALVRATATDGPPLLVLLAGHGQRGEVAADAAIDLWGQSALRAGELAAVLDAAARPVRVVVTSCYSGGFAELAFAGADARRGPARGRCGLFAATAEREASGCDPNPDRAAQEGYALHFLHALRGQDREGRAAAGIDVDGDGRVSLLEAHARARVAGAGIDVPTSTSERWLRAAAPRAGRSAPVSLPEEEAVIAGVAAGLGLVGREGEAAGLLEQVRKDMSEQAGRIDAAAADEDAAYRAVAGELLARWPVLDDPWHPAFAATLTAGRSAISAWLADSGAYAAYRAARAEGEAAQAAMGELLRRSAPLERLVRALETRALAGRLKARGGAGWRAYAELLACERWAP
jgi:hypothetical protein